MPIRGFGKEIKAQSLGSRCCLSSREDSVNMGGSGLIVLDIAEIIILRLE